MENGNVRRRINGKVTLLFCIIKEESFAKSKHLKGMVGRHEAESYLSGVRLVNLATSVQPSEKNC